MGKKLDILSMQRLLQSDRWEIAIRGGLLYQGKFDMMQMRNWIRQHDDIIKFHTVLYCCCMVMSCENTVGCECEHVIMKCKNLEVGGSPEVMLTEWKHCFLV